MLIGLLAAAVASASGPVVIQNPDWLKRPNMAQIQAVWPIEAMRRGVSGRVQLSCQANVHGSLENCVVVSETPPGMGFAAAAISLTPNFQMRPGTRNGQPFVSTVNIPIRFIAHGAWGDDVNILGQEMTVAYPVWLAAPSFSDLARAYPAAANGAAGFAVLKCRIWLTGALTSCTTLSEEPPHDGFDQAARSLVGRFRFSAPPGIFKGHKPVYASVRIRLIDPKGADFQARRIGQPTWVAVPDPAVLASVFPAAAAAKGVAHGLAVAECVVKPDGRLGPCKPLSADPDGLGFSDAAVKVAAAMRMNPWTDDGGPVDGATIQVPIQFNLQPAATAGLEAKSP